MLSRKKVELKDEKIVFDAFFKIYQSTFRFEQYSGELSDELTRLTLDRGDAVAVLLHCEARGTFLLAEQFRFPVYRAGDPSQGWIYELVAGVIEEGESPEDVARREVLEEVGYEVTELKYLTTCYLSPGGTTEKICLYYGKVAQKKGEGGGIAAEHEDIRTVEIPIHKAYEMIDRGEIRDAKTMIGLLLARKHFTG